MVSRRVRGFSTGIRDAHQKRTAEFLHEQLVSLRTVWVDEVVKAEKVDGMWVTTHRMSLINLEESEVLSLEWVGGGASVGAAIESARSSFAAAQTGMEAIG